MPRLVAADAAFYSQAQERSSQDKGVKVIQYAVADEGVGTVKRQPATRRTAPAAERKSF
jgi:hypothetical protein